MTRDMLVALPPATADGHALFGHHLGGPASDRPVSLSRTPGRDHAAGDAVRTTHLTLPQARRSHAVLAGRRGAGWGHDHGVNGRGVAVGWTALRTRLDGDAPALTGPDLVRLALERACSACAAVEVLTDLIGRHGQRTPAGAGTDAALLVADAREAFLIETAGRHWVIGHVRHVKAVTGTCLLRQDWDRISPGLADLAVTCGWIPEDGRKLDFAATVGLPQPDHAAALRRWGQTTLALEQRSGQVEDGFVRRLLRDPKRAGHEAATAGALIVRLGPAPGDLPLAWVGLGPLYLPVLPAGELPDALADGPGGCRLFRAFARWHARTPPEQARDEAAEVQHGLDVRAAEATPEMQDLHRRGPAAATELARLAESFMRHCCERVEEWLSAGDRSPAAPRAGAAEEVFVG